jgi:hypothetical protein
MVGRQFYSPLDKIKLDQLVGEYEMAEFICSLINSVETYVGLTPDSEFWPDNEFHRVLLDESLYPENDIMRLVLDMRHQG